MPRADQLSLFDAGAPIELPAVVAPAVPAARGPSLFDVDAPEDIG